MNSQHGSLSFPPLPPSPSPTVLPHLSPPLLLSSSLPPHQRPRLAVVYYASHVRQTAFTPLMDIRRSVFTGPKPPTSHPPPGILSPYLPLRQLTTLSRRLRHTSSHPPTPVLPASTPTSTLLSRPPVSVLCFISRIAQDFPLP